MNAWTEVLTAHATPADVELVVEGWTQFALADVRRQLDANAALTLRQRLMVLSLAEPVIRERARAALRAGLQQLQRDAAMPQTIR